MPEKPRFETLENDALRASIDLQQIYGVFREVRERSDNYTGSLFWRTINGRDYLIRERRGGHSQKSLGARSPGTEAAYAEFRAGKREAEARFLGVVERINRYAAVAKALGAGRVPVEAANVLRALDRRRLLGANIAVAGTHSLYAYETMAGIRFDQEMMQTEDLDLFWDARSRIRLRYWGDDPPRILAVLREADRSFEPVKQTPYRVAATSGFIVDVIKEQAGPPWKDSDAMSPGDLLAAPIREMRWIANAPKVETVAIDLDGYPAPIVAADPRAYALFKLWLSTQNDRNPSKRPRDQAQALAVAALVNDKLRHLPFTREHLTMFPAEIVTRSEQTPAFFRGGVPADDPPPPPKKRKKPRRMRGFTR